MRRVAFLLVLTVAAAAGPKYVTVRLQDGQQIMGKVIEDECTDEILVVRQIRPPKKTRIPWTNISEKQARELRVQLGFEAADSVPEALMMKGHRIQNKVHTVFQGLWVNPDTAKKDGVFILKTSEGERRIRAIDVMSGPDDIELSKLEVYTTRELYALKMAESPPESAEDHFRVAEFCFYIDAFEEAKHHYEKVLEFNDPKYTQAKLERNLSRVQRMIDQADAREALQDIKRAIVYKKFDKGRELIAAFKEQYKEEADLIAMADRYATELEKDRDKHFASVTPRLLRDAVQDLLERRIKEEKEWTLREAQRYAEGEPTNEDSVTRHALDKVAGKLEISTEEVLKYWNSRPKRNTYKAFYRDGTFVVIEDLEDALAKVKKPSGGGKKGPSPPKPSPPMTKEGWWEIKKKQRKWRDLGDWLYAYWAEKSGMCDPLPPKEELCQTCFGKGYTTKMHTTPEGSVPFYNRCQTCYMAKHFRVVKFK